MSSQLDPAAHIGWGERQTDIYPVDHFQLQRRVHRRLTHHEPIGLLDKLGNGLPAVRISARTTGT
ncbi:MAG TPA: hypothetical protein VFS96_07705, partial [Nitrolancea sp.]|nr:hypothetical protein [Nitrolancea sp.]